MHLIADWLNGTNKRFRFINDDDGISLEGFSDILRAIETEEYDLEDYPEDFQIAADYVQFHPHMYYRNIL